MPHIPAFPNLPKGTVGAKMIRHDLHNTSSHSEEAIQYKGSAGKVADFHALRHSFVTALANSGVHPATAQKLARHSSIELTMNRYTHSVLESQQAAVESLPKLKIFKTYDTVKEGTIDSDIVLENSDSELCPNRA